MPSTISRTNYNALVEDSGDKVSGSVWDKADVSDLLTDVENAWTTNSQFSMGGSVCGENLLTPPQITVGQANYSPTGMATAFTLKLDASGALAIDGILAGTEGRFLFIHNNGNFNITFTHEGGAATAANRFYFVGAANFVLTPNMVIGMLYTSSRWRRFNGA